MFAKRAEHEIWAAAKPNYAANPFFLSNFFTTRE